mmetsp:Transcript_2301/g.7286  ORF Transcript_2301/g.7286 Transcript_2301/m.7286 type:complete len:361 (-) Transcript_2301:17-1099(-)
MEKSTSRSRSGGNAELSRRVRTFGTTPTPLISAPDGDWYFASVSTTAPPLRRPKTPWITPLPYVPSPMIVARHESRSAPASTSLALADLLSTRTATGALGGTIRSSLAAYVVIEPKPSTTLTTAAPRPMKKPPMPSAPSSTPPRLPRRSSTYPSAPRSASERRVWPTCLLPTELNSESWTYPTSIASAPLPTCTSRLRTASLAVKLRCSETVYSPPTGAPSAAARRRSIVTVSSALLWMTSSASKGDLPAIETPLIPSTVSPKRTPARSLSEPFGGTDETMRAPSDGRRITFTLMPVTSYFASAAASRGESAREYLSPRSAYISLARLSTSSSGMSARVPSTRRARTAFQSWPPNVRSMK